MAYTVFNTFDKLKFYIALHKSCVTDHGLMPEVLHLPLKLTMIIIDMNCNLLATLDNTDNNTTHLDLYVLHRPDLHKTHTFLIR